MTEAPVTTRRKYAQVLAGATQVFMEQGYEGASVDEIAAAAQVSKATLYSYFPDKQELFRQVIIAECSRQANMAIDLEALDDPPEVVLERAATQLMTFILSPFGQQIYRVCVAEAARFPELGLAFYNSGPKLGRQRIEAYLRCAAKAGQLNIDMGEVEVASDQFAQLCRTDAFYRIILGVDKKVTKEHVQRRARQAVKTFMARFA